jgi:hypothetical protein
MVASGTFKSIRNNIKQKEKACSSTSFTAICGSFGNWVDDGWWHDSLLGLA